MQITFILKVFFLSLLLSLSAFGLYAQKYEAEDATLTGGATRQACVSCSGGYYVAQGEGKLSFQVSLPVSGFYTLAVRASAPNGDKTNTFAVNGTSTDFFLDSANQYATHIVVHSLKLEAGQHQVEIRKSWGWINIDYMDVEKVDASKRFNLNQELVTPNPIPEAKALYDFLLDNYGQKILSGVMTLKSMDEVNWLRQQTGKEPVVLGLDFMHSGRGYGWYDNREPVRDAQQWYGRNGVPTLMWHWRDPSRKTEAFYTINDSKPDGTGFDISQILDNSSTEYKLMLQDIDYVAGLLKELQEQRVPVIWRPLHEAAGGWFWWGAKGPEPLKALWRLMYDRMVNHHGLQNLIWVWTREPGDEAWYPGDAYVDIVGRDIYKDGDHSAHPIEFNNVNALYGGKKMVTLSEVGSFPDPDSLLKNSAGWSWFMPWYGGHTRDSKYNPLELWQKTMVHDYVLTLDEMPELSAYQRKMQEPTGSNNMLNEGLGLIVFPTVSNDSLTIRSGKRLEAVALYNMLGTLLKKQQVNANETVISLTGLAPGVYLVKTNGGQTVRVIKN